MCATTRAHVRLDPKAGGRWVSTERWRHRLRGRREARVPESGSAGLGRASSRLRRPRHSPPGRNTREGGRQTERGRPAEAKEAPPKRRAGRAQAAPRRRWGRSVQRGAGGPGRAEQRDHRTRSRSPGLADAALADNENLQRGQHVLVHPVGAPGPDRQTFPTRAAAAPPAPARTAAPLRSPLAGRSARAPKPCQQRGRGGKQPPPFGWRVRRAEGAEPALAAGLERGGGRARVCGWMRGSTLTCGRCPGCATGAGQVVGDREPWALVFGFCCRKSMKKEIGLGLQMGRRKLDLQGDGQLPVSALLELRTLVSRSPTRRTFNYQPCSSPRLEARGLVVGASGRATMAMVGQWLCSAFCFPCPISVCFDSNILFPGKFFWTCFVMKTTKEQKGPAPDSP